MERKTFREAIAEAGEVQRNRVEEVRKEDDRQVRRAAVRILEGITGAKYLISQDVPGQYVEIEGLRFQATRRNDTPLASYGLNLMHMCERCQRPYLFPVSSLADIADALEGWEHDEWDHTCRPIE